MAGQRTRFFGWCEPSAYCRKHDGTQLTGSLHCRRFNSVGQLGARVGRGRVDQVNGGADSEPSEVAPAGFEPAPLGYEPYDVRLRRLALSLVAALTSADGRRAFMPGLITMPRFRPRPCPAGARRSGSPRSRILASSPCSAGWSVSRPEITVSSPSSLTWRPSNQAAHWLVQDAVDADLVMGTPPGGAHSSSSQRPAWGAIASAAADGRGRGGAGHGPPSSLVSAGMCR